MRIYHHRLGEEVLRLYEENSRLKAEVDRLKGKSIFLPETQGTKEAAIDPVIHNLPIPAFLIDLESERILDVNQPFIRLSANGSEQFVGRSMDETSLLEIPDTWQKLLERLRTTGQSQSATLGVRNQHGEYVPTMVSVREIRIQDLPRALSLFIDIGSRSGLEQIPLESQLVPREFHEGLILQLIFDTLPVTAWTRDLDLRYTWLSHPVVQGFTLDSVIGKRDVDLLPDRAEAEKIENILRQVIVQQKAIRREVEFHIQGRAYYFELTAQPLFDENRIVVGVVGVTYDLSRIRQAEERLLQQEAHFRKAFQDAGLVAARIDRDLRYEWIHNPHPDFDPETVIGKRDDDLLGPQAAAEIMALKKEVLDTGNVIRRILTFNFSTGTGYYDTTVVPYWDEQGNIRGLTTTSVDVTPLKRAEKQLRDLNRNLELIVTERTAQVRELSRLMLITEQRERSKIAHILQEHVQQMLVSTQMKVMSLLQDTSALAPEVADRILSLYEMLKETLKSVQLISAELSPPFIRSEGLDVALEWLAAYMKRLYALDVSIRIVRRKRIQNDDVRLLVVNILRELLINVAKHAGVDQVQVSLHPRGEMMVIVVEDQGKGFDVADVMQNYSSNECIGLICAKQQLELFGGQMEITSSVGNGTCVSITVPVDAKVP